MALIKHLKERCRDLRILGLTATPTRTNELKGVPLGRIFHSGVVFETDLKSLIARGYLSQPVFEEHDTGVSLDLTSRQIEKARRLDLSGLGDKTIHDLAKNSIRNNRIVNAYASNPGRYGQTLVYAINIDNALALDGLFRKKGIKSAAVVSSLRDGSGASVSSEINAQHIEAFRNKDLDVLVNVNILTEGVDVPGVQSVFLARPTISTILMTQMIGRGLRGPRAGGTEKTYIASFIDDWKDKIAWVNPEQLYLEEHLEQARSSDRSRPDLVRLVGISKIVELATLLDPTVDTTWLEELPFIERIPVGFYFIRYLSRDGSNEYDERNREILVYDNVKDLYRNFIDDLPKFVESYGMAQSDDITDADAQFMALKAEEHYFYETSSLLAYDRNDLEELIRFHVVTGAVPEFFELADRALLDIDKLASQVLNMNAYERRDFLEAEWEQNDRLWSAFFGHNKRSFIHEVDLAIRRILYPGVVSLPPRPTPDERAIEDLSLFQLRSINPRLWQEITETVYTNARRKDGCYECALSGFASPDRWRFEIDHIEPMANGGKTVLKNLRLLERSVNRRLGAEMLKRLHGLDSSDQS